MNEKGITKKNAIILAAGRSNRFAPFTYEKPKGLFTVKGQTLIDRQIEQLKEAGVEEIYVVVGYMKEKFFYLAQKYNVKIVVNNTFNSKGNIYSLYEARKYMANTYICCADHYYIKNPFMENFEESSRACTYMKGKFREIAAAFDESKRINSIAVGGADGYCMIGYAYFTEELSKKFVDFLEKEINDFGVDRMLWEEFLGRHLDDFDIQAKIYEETDILEFDSIEELSHFDTGFIDNVDSKILYNITSILGCRKQDIKNIVPLNKGLSNISFLFEATGRKYVYRHPGGSADNFVNRKSEAFSERVAKEMELDRTVIYVDEKNGWKISSFVDNCYEFSYDNEEDVKTILQMIKKLHDSNVQGEYVFDVMNEADKLMRIACSTKGNLFEEFKELRSQICRLYHFVESDAVPKVLCHNDCYKPNFLMHKEQINLIDWEFTGMSDPGNDFGGIVAREWFDDETVAKYLNLYLGHEATPFEKRHFYAHVALTGYYFFCWSLFKDSIGEASGDFMFNSYNNAIKYSEICLPLYCNTNIEI